MIAIQKSEFETLGLFNTIVTVCSSAAFQYWPISCWVSLGFPCRRRNYEARMALVVRYWYLVLFFSPQ